MVCVGSGSNIDSILWEKNGQQVITEDNIKLTGPDELLGSYAHGITIAKEIKLKMQLTKEGNSSRCQEMMDLSGKYQCNVVGHVGKDERVVSSSVYIVNYDPDCFIIAPGVTTHTISTSTPLPLQGMIMSHNKSII